VRILSAISASLANLAFASSCFAASPKSSNARRAKGERIGEAAVSKELHPGNLVNNTHDLCYACGGNNIKHRA